MAARINKDLPNLEVELVEGRSGIFQVKLGDDVLWDKSSQNGQFPDEGFITEKVQSLMPAEIKI